MGMYDGVCIYLGKTKRKPMVGNVSWGWLSRTSFAIGFTHFLHCAGLAYIHQQNGPDYPLDVHSWYFMYDESLLANPPPPPVGFPAPAPVGFPTAPPVEFAAPPPTYEATFQQ